MLKSKTVLIVDDEPNNLDLLSRYVQREGHATLLAPGGIEALRVVGDKDVDLILLDWMMPDLSGIDVLRAVRESRDASSLPIIMCTALGDGEHIAAALSEGANDFVTKPIDRAVLKARLSSQLQRTAAMKELEVINTDLEKVIAERTKALLGVGDGALVSLSEDERAELVGILQTVSAADSVVPQVLRNRATSALQFLQPQGQSGAEKQKC